jgi:hypothetical protein
MLYRETVTYTPDGRVIWPFPIVNGQQTDQSKALQADKSQHKPKPHDLSNVEEALL